MENLINKGINKVYDYFNRAGYSGGLGGRHELNNGAYMIDYYKCCAGIVIDHAKVYFNKAGRVVRIETLDRTTCAYKVIGKF